MAFEQYLRKPRYTLKQYLHMLRKLLPKGENWGVLAGDTGSILYDTYNQEAIINDAYTGEEDTINDTIEGSLSGANTPFGVWLSVVAGEFRRVEERAYDLVREAVPGLANEMLPEWYYMTVRDEYEAALVGDDLDAQRALAHSKIFTEGQVTTAAWFEEYGASLGFTLTVNENPYYGVPFRVGEGRCGSPLASTGALSYVEIDVTVLSTTVSQDLLMGLFDAAKPAHTLLLWTWP